MSAASTPALLTPHDLEQRLRAALSPSRLEVLDESAAHLGHAGTNAQGLGTHFRVRLASPLFQGLGRVGQHRLVYDALADCPARGLHALAIEVLHPDSHC